MMSKPLNHDHKKFEMIMESLLDVGTIIQTHDENTF